MDFVTNLLGGVIPSERRGETSLIMGALRVFFIFLRSDNCKTIGNDMWVSLSNFGKNCVKKRCRCSQTVRDSTLVEMGLRSNAVVRCVYIQKKSQSLCHHNTAKGYEYHVQNNFYLVKNIYICIHQKLFFIFPMFSSVSFWITKKLKEKFLMHAKQIIKKFDLI